MRDYEPYYTQDGSIGLYSFADKDVFHSKFGALTEAWEKFIIPSGLEDLEHDNIKVLDVCYGIGYNTKALLSFFIENYKNNRKNFIKKFLYKIFNIVSIGVNKISREKRIKLLPYNDTICSNKKITIDCLEINSELVELSPFFKTTQTADEIFDKFIPSVFDCFEFYNNLKLSFNKLYTNIRLKNRKEINELLDIKFNEMKIDKEYKLHPYVNYILINSLSKYFSENYPSKNLKKILLKSKNRRFFDKTLINYANFNQFWGYNLSIYTFLSVFLHNIYYCYLSFRDKNVNFKTAQSLFDVRFHINDARKTIQSLNEQYDCIYLDAFTYTKAPQLWSVEFIAELYKRLSSTGVLLTYSNSVQVRNTLLENKFYVGKIYNEKLNKFVGTIASKDKSKIKYPLNSYEIGLCNTKAGIPYHDPNLSFSNKDILELREYEYKHSNLMSSSKYIKTRGK